MNVPDYYDWRAAEQYYDSLDYGLDWDNSMFIVELPVNLQVAIKFALSDYLVKEEGMEEDTEELDRILENAMDGRLWDIEDYVDLDKIFEEN